MKEFHVKINGSFLFSEKSWMLKQIAALRVLACHKNSKDGFASLPN
jgi:hypothetical protein